MKNIYLINSGKPEYKSNPLDYKHEIMLSNFGLKQSRAIGYALQHKSIDLIVSSDFNVAMATAACIAHGQESSLLTSIQLRDQSQEETQSSFINRVMHYYNGILERDEANIAIVSHTNVIRAVIVNILGISQDLFNRLTIDYGSISIVVKEGDICYLKALNTKVPL